MVKKIDINDLFKGLQKEMLSSLGVLQIGHAPSLGEYTELSWLNLFRTYLPKRYMADKAFVVDHNGCLSDAIDIVVYDAFYSPFLLNKNGVKFVPAESVYATFEVKQDITKAHIEYAGNKAKSVRNLDRTSVPINNAGKVVNAKKHSEIISGLLCTRSSWVNLKSSRKLSKQHILNQKEDMKLNLSCCLEVGSMSLINNCNSVKFSSKANALISFFFEFLQKLQNIGTAPAMDITKYFSGT
tara:strand:- start:1854 stop:2576 length:723 start_codon:yes stop_codon:yes gene_type:complete